jgi:hypothetical protein
LVTELPDGWSRTATHDPGKTGDSTPIGVNVYATDAAPLAPVLVVTGSVGGGLDPQPTSIPVLSGYSEASIGGKRAVLASFQGNPAGFIEVDGHWVFVRGSGIDEATFRGLLAAVVRRENGSAEIAASALPAGMRLVISADTPISPVVFAGGQGDNALSVYQGSSAEHRMTLSVWPASADDGAWMALQYPDVEPTQLDGRTAYVATGPAATFVYWQRDGLAFQLYGLGVEGEAVLQAAASVQRASDIDWEQTLAVPADERSIAPPGTAPAETGPVITPAETLPAFTGTPHDSPIDIVVETMSEYEQIWTETRPGEEPWTFHVLRLFDQVLVDAREGDSGVSISPSWPPAEGVPQILCCPATVLTDDPQVAALRIVLNTGERYTIPLHDLPGVAGVRIAVGGGISTVQTIDLIDADGNIVESTS